MGTQRGYRVEQLTPVADYTDPKVLQIICCSYGGNGA
jgi:hypothetical protein